MPQRPLVITTCSASKRCRRLVGIDGLARGAQKSVADAWLRTIAGESRLTPARSLYGGRAFGLALRSVERLGADLGVISAGLGYVLADTPIPGYDLTIRSSGSGSIVQHIDGDFDTKAWWRSVAGGSFACDPVADLVGRSLVLMCVSRAYATMIEDDLLEMAAVNPTALRIFGLSIGSALPESLRIYALPYDERLGRLGLAGTRVDFPQRALLDYVEHIAPHRGDLESDRSAVETRMANAGQVDGSRRHQNRVDDQAIRELISDLIPSVGPSRARLLEYIRHERGVSCEQRRFSKLYDDVRGDSVS